MARLIGIVPLGIGLTVLAFAWSNEFDGGFGSIPVFFRLFVSFIALGFILIGGAILFAGFAAGVPSSMVKHVVDLQQQLHEGMAARGLTPPGDPGRAPQMTSDGYVCPSCNAPIGKKADVSPHGDVKCTHCGRWFNVHG
jgi:DNA-directed RNA polymerase subunit RPC12/RpoP